MKDSAGTPHCLFHIVRKRIAGFFMTDREKIVSNDYYDLITDFVLPGGVSANLRDAVYQPVSGEIGISYVNRNDIPPMSVSNFTYPIIPSLYGLMQIAESFDPTSLIHSGITQIQGSALALTGRGVVIGFLDTGIRYEEEVFRNEDGSTRILGIWIKPYRPVSRLPVFFMGRNTKESRSMRHFKVKIQDRSCPAMTRSATERHLQAWRQGVLCGTDWDSWEQRHRQTL